jgi:hypothetical protein
MGAARDDHVTCRNLDVDRAIGHLDAPVGTLIRKVCVSATLVRLPADSITGIHRLYIGNRTWRLPMSGCEKTIGSLPGSSHASE